ncbi:MAG: tail fiber domain-containing protein [Candidatus Omnitrophica bacterium]|nr:tail fiber domain-containing protein [Candidatus Omnitrophota bacterium]
MTKKFVFTIFPVLCLMLLTGAGVKAEETITLTTYYPAPYGEYDSLSVGSGYTASTTDGTLTVEGSVGIKTEAPNAPLVVYGGEGSYTAPNFGSTNRGAIQVRSLTSNTRNAITFSQSTADSAQAGIYVHQDNAAGTHMYLATTNSYATGPQARLTILNTGYVGIGTTSPAYPLHMASGAYCSAGGAWTNASDIAFKENITDLDYGLNEIMLIQPKKFTIKKDGSRQIGFIAQEMEQVVPEIVSGKDGEKGISYGNLNAVLVNAVKELQAQIDILKNEVTELRQKLDKQP